jgi:hypothetical protein
LRRDRAENLLAAAAAKRLSRLHCGTASVAEHDLSLAHFRSIWFQNQIQQMIRKHCSGVPFARSRNAEHSALHPVAEQNEKATRQLGGLFFKGE